MGKILQIVTSMTSTEIKKMNWSLICLNKNGDSGKVLLKLKSRSFNFYYRYTLRFMFGL